MIVGNNADEILPGLWLGNFNSSKDEVFLKTKNISTVFNCTKDREAKAVSTIWKWRGVRAVSGSMV